MKIGVFRGINLYSPEIDQFLGLSPDQVTFIGSTQGPQLTDPLFASYPTLYVPTINNKLTHDGLATIINNNFDIIDVVGKGFESTLQLSRNHLKVVVHDWENLPFHQQWFSNHPQAVYRRSELGFVDRKGLAEVYRNGAAFIGYSCEATEVIELESQALTGNSNLVHVTIYPAVHPMFYKPSLSRSELIPLMQDKRVILFAGRIDAFKGVHELLIAFSFFRKKYDSMLVFSEKPKQSTPDCKARLVELIDLLNIKDHVLFLGDVDRSLTPALYKSVDVVVNTSNPHPLLWKEQVGMVLLEAAVVGTPIVGSNCGGHAELFNPRFLANPCDYKDVQSLLHLSACINHTESQLLLDRSHFSVQSIGKQLEDLYDAV